MVPQPVTFVASILFFGRK